MFGENKYCEREMAMNRFKAAVLLLTTTFFWGVTFTLVKQALEGVDVFVFLAQRFMLAFAVILPISFVRGRSLSVRTIRQGCIMGLFLFGAYAFQTVALLYTSASNTGFLTGLNVIMVPLISSLMLRHHITGTIKCAVALSVVGLFLLCGNGTWSFNLGDLLAAVCAVCVSLHMIYTGEFARSSDYYWLTAVQLGVVALLSLFCAYARHQHVFVWHPQLLGTLLVCSLIATVFAFLVQTSMQRFISHTNTALIFCTEPVFAALYAWIAIDERLGLYGLMGALLILTGMVVSILPARRKPVRNVVLSLDEGTGGVTVPPSLPGDYGDLGLR
jgi:drug/metabolite transporter (DMT)-like permease